MPTTILGSAREVAKNRPKRITRLVSHGSREARESLIETLKDLIEKKLSTQQDIDQLAVQLHCLQFLGNEIFQAFRR